MFEFLQKGENISAFAATEAVVVARVGPNVKAWRFLVVKRAQALERVHPGPAKSDMSSNDIGDVGARSNLVNV